MSKLEYYMDKLQDYLPKITEALGDPRARKELHPRMRRIHARVLHQGLSKLTKQELDIYLEIMLLIIPRPPSDVPIQAQYLRKPYVKIKDRIKAGV